MTMKRCPKDRVLIHWNGLDFCAQQVERDEPCFCDNLPEVGELAGRGGEGEG